MQLKTIHDLGNTLVANDSRLRVAFQEADKKTDTEISAQHFLKFDEKRICHDFEYYAFKVHIFPENTGTKFIMLDILDNIVLPLSEKSPKAYEAGLAFLKKQAHLMGEARKGWEQVIAGYQASISRNAQMHHIRKKMGHDKKPSNK